MHIRISIPAQSLELMADDGLILRRYAISSSSNGTGQQRGSYCTPLGRHIIRAKVGAGMPANTVFIRRRPTGETWSPVLAAQHPNRDWILTRILWLSGTERGFNRLGDVDTMRRFIYLHGTPDTTVVGMPGSIGCIRMRNADIIELFDLVPASTRVDIVNFSVESALWDVVASSARPLREAVFIHEQGVPLEMEWDEFDVSSLHAIARDARGAAIGTGRLLPDGHIGRMAVLPEWRGKGVGRAILEHLLQLAQTKGMKRLVLNSQTHAADFYGECGFAREGGEFMEAGIPHVRMCRAL